MSDDTGHGRSNRVQAVGLGDAIEGLQGQSAAVLALLTWAHLQSERFEAGWTTVPELARYTVIGTEPANVRRGLNRALHLLLKIEALPIEVERRQRRVRVRLTPPIPPSLFAWFQEKGRGYLMPTFSSMQSPPMPASSELGRLTSEALREIASQFFSEAEWEQYLESVAAAHEGTAPSATEWAHCARLLVSATDVLLGTAAIGQVQKLRAVLATHLTVLPAESTHDLLIAEGQAAVALSRCAVRVSLLSRPTWPLTESCASECAGACRRAAPSIPELPFQNRGDAALADAALVLHEAASGRLDWDTATRAIEGDLEKATMCFRLAGSLRGLMDVLALRTEASVFSWLTQSSNRMSPIRVSSGLGKVTSSIELDADELATPLGVQSISMESELAVLTTLIWSTLNTCLPGQSEYWIIAWTRYALFQVSRITRDFTAETRARTARGLSGIRGELRLLERLASPASMPFVDYVRDVVEAEAAALAIDLKSHRSTKAKSGSRGAEPDALQLGTDAVKRDRKLRAMSELRRQS